MFGFSSYSDLDIIAIISTSTTLVVGAYCILYYYYKNSKDIESPLNNIKEAEDYSSYDSSVESTVGKPIYKNSSCIEKNLNDIKESEYSPSYDPVENLNNSIDNFFNYNTILELIFNDTVLLTLKLILLKIIILHVIISKFYK